MRATGVCCLAVTAVVVLGGCGDDWVGAASESVDAPSLAADWIAQAAPTIARERLLDCRAPETLFVNFDGVTLTASSSCEDASRNCSTVLSQLGGPRTATIPRFSGTAQARQQIVERIGDSTSKMG